MTHTGSPSHRPAAWVAQTAGKAVVVGALCAMRLDPRLGGAAALRLLLAAHVVAAFEPITVGIAIGAASVLTGYLSYKDLYCRFAECCRSERPLNASGTAGLPWRGSRGAGDRPLAGVSAPAPRAHPSMG